MKTLEICLEFRFFMAKPLGLKFSHVNNNTCCATVATVTQQFVVRRHGRESKCEMVTSSLAI